MTRLLALIFAVIAAASPALSNPLIRQSPDRWLPHSTVGVLDRVTIRIHWYESLAALREAATNSGVMARSLHGFSTLHRNTRSGEYVCDVFVLKMTGAVVDNDRTVTFGHEVLHCLGLSHK